MRIGLIIRRVCLIIWLAFLLFCAYLYLSNPQLFTAEHIAAFLLRFENAIFFGYLGISIIRGFTLLPSTPLVIAGTLLYPQQPWLVLSISLAGILLSSTMLYFFSEFLGFSYFFEGHKPELTHRIRAGLERPTGFAFVALWAFFPFVPTDLVCYVAGTTRMNFFKFIAAVFGGELVLCSFYIFFGGAIMNYLR